MPAEERLVPLNGYQNWVPKGIHKGGHGEFVFFRRLAHIIAMRLIFSQFLGFVAAGSTLLALAGCNGMSEVGFDTKMTLGSVSTVDRCSDFMRRAFPNSFIDVVDSHVVTDTQGALVTVQGVRGDVPANSAYARAVAVECHFESGILTGFRWIAGPIRSAAPAPAR